MAMNRCTRLTVIWPLAAPLGGLTRSQSPPALVVAAAVKVAPDPAALARVNTCAGGRGPPNACVKDRGPGGDSDTTVFGFTINVTGMVNGPLGRVAEVITMEPLYVPNGRPA